MNEDYPLEYKETPSHEEEMALLNGINEESYNAKQLSPITAFSYFIKNGQGKVLAGVKGVTYYGCLYVDTLWVAADFRHKGWGTKLMAASEELGKQRSCRFSTVATMDWEALPFYQKLGYQIEYIREGYDKNSKMYVLRKNL